MSSTGGRITLRLSSTDATTVVYDGELTADDASSSFRVTIGAESGTVDVAQLAGDAPPEWLVKIVRATLRTAWRSSRTGTPWPRRLSRWRGGPEGD